MTEQSIVENSAPTKHAVRVEWFQHDPGGGTTFIVPPGSSAPKSIAEEIHGGVSNPPN